MTRTAIRHQTVATSIRRPVEQWVWRDASDDDVVRQPRPAIAR
jgi:hypothetical protein